MPVSINIDDKLLAMYAFYVALAIGKVFMMVPLTGFARKRTRTFANPEDVTTVKGGKVGVHDDVERVRRAHLNDLENVIPFTVIGLVYLMIAPSYAVAIWHFRVFVASRIVHTIGYLNESHKFRGLGFGCGFIVCLSMLVQVIVNTCCST